jgi:homoserine dehydrogenase
MGILNGTSNYILTKMARENLSFESAVADAVALGFAEDPPTLDVDGTDAAHKLAIMMSIAFGSAIDFDQVFREGHCCHHAG